VQDRAIRSVEQTNHIDFYQKCKASSGHEAASCRQVAVKGNKGTHPVRCARPVLRSVGPNRGGRTVTYYRPLEQNRQFPTIRPRCSTLGGEEALPPPSPRHDRGDRRLSTLLLVDEKIPRIPFQILGRMEGESQKISGQTRTAETNTERTQRRTPPPKPVPGSRSNRESSRRMDFRKRCLPHALSSTDDRRRDDRGPSGKSEHLGPIRKIPPLLGGEEESDGRRLRARGGPESHPSPRHSLPPRDPRVFSARPLSEPEEEFRTLAGGVHNTSSSRHRA